MVSTYLYYTLSATAGLSIGLCIGFITAYKSNKIISNKHLQSAAEALD
jgi:hypothetical protein